MLRASVILSIHFSLRDFARPYYLLCYIRKKNRFLEISNLSVPLEIATDVLTFTEDSHLCPLNSSKQLQEACPPVVLQFPLFRHWKDAHGSKRVSHIVPVYS